MSGEQFAKDKSEAMKGSSGMDPRQLAMQSEQDNQQAP